MEGGLESFKAYQQHLVTSTDKDRYFRRTTTENLSVYRRDRSFLT